MSLRTKVKKEDAFNQTGYTHDSRFEPVTGLEVDMKSRFIALIAFYSLVVGV